MCLSAKLVKHVLGVKKSILQSGYGTRMAWLGLGTFAGIAGLTTSNNTASFGVTLHSFLVLPLDDIILAGFITFSNTRNHI